LELMDDFQAETILPGQIPLAGILGESLLVCHFWRCFTRVADIVASCFIRHPALTSSI
jgi:hypothetical protein